MDHAVRIYIPVPLPAAAAWAVSELAAALKGRGVVVDDASDDAIEVIIGPPAPATPEAFVIEQPDARRWLIAGADDVGLMYGLLEAADAIALGEDPSPLENLQPTRQQPAIPWRSLQMFRNHELMEQPWYFSDEFWIGYLKQLARCRFNNLTLTFSHQSSFLAPPYPFHVELPEFPTVKTPSCDAAGRQRNLAMLQRISSLARQRGIHCSLGIWQQHDCGFGTPMVEGLTPAIIGEVNAVGLRRLLEACPAIDGLQFRMNSEAGVPEHEQEQYWAKQFAAIAAVGRPIHVDIRAKGLSNATIARAQSLLGDVAVSTKFWCEHFGLPYVMPAIQRFDVTHYRRYGTWDMLRKPRPFKLIHQFWTAGSQRLLLWGDPQYVRRFARSVAQHGDGFEVMASLTNKGGRNEGPAWPIFKDPALLPFTFEDERYWLFYELFGRIGYDADADSVHWRRQFKRRFGSAGPFVEEAIGAASQVLPLLSTVLAFSAGMWALWPETFAGRTLREDMRIEPSDPTRFYGVEEWSEAALQGKLDGRWTPFHIATRLRELAAWTRHTLEKAGALVESSHREFPGTRHDLLVLADLADYHAYRMEAGALFAASARSASRSRLLRAIAAMEKAVAVWKQLSERTTNVYADDLLFGRRDRGHGGHWRDRLSIAEADLDALQKEDTGIGPDLFPTPLPDPPLLGEGTYPKVVAPVLAAPPSASAGQPLTLSLTWRDPAPAVAVTCHIKPMLQTMPFTTLPMRETSPGTWTVTIDAAMVTPHWDLIAFVQIDLPGGQAVRFPDWRETDPYVTIRTT